MPTSDVVVVMVPFVAQGHLNQLLHLSRLISTYNIPIHFISTTTHCRQARDRLHGWHAHDNFIKFHPLHDPDFTSPNPEPNTTTQFPTHLQPSFNSSLHLRHPVADIIRSLAKTSRRVVVVHDSIMSYVVQDVKFIQNAETYIFRALSVFYILCFNLIRLGKELPFTLEMKLRLPDATATVSQEFTEFLKLQYSHQTFHVGNIYDSSRVIEGKFLEYVEKDEIMGKRHWAVGPFNPVEISPDVSSSAQQDRHACLKWLDKQPEKSVIYVSFGTTTTFLECQIRELALGLEKSEQRFLWVLRDADKGDVFKKDTVRRLELPEGFECRIEGRGLVVREWAPQPEILGHFSVGGFMSHCGWNSCMEAMTGGVAIIAWPGHSDQPHNACLLVDVLGVGLLMREWACRDELVTSVMVETMVRKLMGAGEGVEIRKRATELGGELRRSLGEGGGGRKELDSLISYITR
ncbi:hypothetical protein QVD17_34551 [Tagetes erecta]|uniref:Glycosyltransferase N-terminal domain-containing protein n=1 Tax=Tagetes erecta TaxID=13708 RepID=A0AAD8K279_TARER|nr:hypothetical protein QVD17_34551 [Tagetes erecta]